MEPYPWHPTPGDLRRGGFSAISPHTYCRECLYGDTLLLSLQGGRVQLLAFLYARNENGEDVMSYDFVGQANDFQNFLSGMDMPF